MRTAGVPAMMAALGFPFCAESNESLLETTSPLAVEATYTGDLWRNVRGGLRRDGTYLDNLDVTATLDAERAFGLSGTTFFVYGLHNNRATFSDRIVGDIQTVSNIDTDGATRLYEAWMERTFASGAMRIGLMDLNSELDVNDTGGLFLNSSHGIGPELSQVGENGPSIFPITGLGALLRWDVSERVQARVAAFEATVGDPDHPRRTTIDVESDEGALVIGELTVRPSESFRTLLGVWNHTKENSLGVYALGEGSLLELQEHALAGFVRIGFADDAVHQVARYQGAGLTWSGPIVGSASHEEQLGLAVARITTSRAFRGAHEKYETALELTYRARLTDWLALQPDVQYILNPGTDPTLEDALVIGLRFELRFSPAP